MKAYVLKKSGKPSTLKISEVDEPKPSDNEVKVKVSCLGINYAEILSRKGQYQWSPKRPYILGMEGMGEVVEIGSQVQSVRVGDKVIIGSQLGMYAEFACVPEHLCFPAFDEFTDEENAAFLVNFMTAWVALVKMCRVKSGERVLIHAAAGGVGTAAIQIAKKISCDVLGTASKEEKLELIKSLGADYAIDYSKNDFASEVMMNGGKVDAVLEVVGGDVFKKSLNLLNPFGRMAVIGFASISFKIWNPFSWLKTWLDAPKANIMSMVKNSYGIYASHIGYLTDNIEVTRTIWDELQEFSKQNELKPVIGKVFTFDNLTDAHEHMESRQSVGKIVVRL